MFFGLMHSPATFQTMMDDIFEDLISEGVVVVYLDDILIFTETLESTRRSFSVFWSFWKNISSTSVPTNVSSKKP